MSSLFRTRPSSGPRSAAAAAGSARRLHSIRWQVVLSLAGASVLVALALFPVARQGIDASFGRFESAHARQEAIRLQVLLREQARSLERTALDYSRWDDAVAFVLGREPDWATTQLSDDVLENFDTELIVIADSRMRTLAERRAPRHASHADSRRAAVDARLCGAALARREPTHRFAMRHGQPHVLVCSPIYSATRPAFVPGVLMWVAELSGTRRQAIADLARFDFALRAPSPRPAFAMRVDADTLHATLPVPDADGRIGLQADIALPRPLGPQRAVATRIVLVLLALALLLPPLIALVLLDTLVVRRIQHMSQWVRGMRLGGPATLDRELHAVMDGRAGFAELQMLGNDVAALTAHLEALRAQWQQQAMRDSLTGLGNRACLVADLDRALAAGAEPLGLLQFDLDGFKAVNDMLGHGAGDLLLRDVAQHLETALPEGARGYRLGGDEFAAILPLEGEAFDAFAESLASQIRFVRHAQGRPLVVTASTGLVDAGPDIPCRTASALLTEVDVAMYTAKRAGRGLWQRSSSGERARQREQFEVAGALRGALEDGRVHAWFQPIVAAHDGRLMALEALARWEEPGWGWVPPTRFVPVAERARLVHELDLAVLASALPVFARLREGRAGLSLHANMAAPTLAEPTFVNRFVRLLEAHQVPPQAVAVELTESDITVRHGQLEHALQQLRALGVALVVDDFGVGASSLARVAALKPEIIKIDGSFVQDLEGDGGAICRVVIELARELGVVCVAEYVESAHQARRLAAMACDGLQGHGPGEPMPAEALAGWLRARDVQAAWGLPAP